MKSAWTNGKKTETDETIKWFGNCRFRKSNERKTRKQNEKITEIVYASERNDRERKEQ